MPDSPHKLTLLSAGRRIDAVQTQPAVFPLANVDLVRARIGAFLDEHSPGAVVAGAACGSDLLVLDEARKRGAELHVVLSSTVAEFRESSVADRPGDWSTLYDDLLSHLPAGSITELHLPAGQESYVRANRVMAETAHALGNPMAALIVWNGVSRGSTDVTNHLRELAAAKGAKVHEILTNG